MLPPEMMGPPAPAPDAGGAGLPPELMAMLGGGGGGAPAPLPSAPPAEEAAGGSVESRVDRVLAELLAILQEDGFSEQEKVAFSKAESLIRGVLASSEKDQDDLMSGKISPGAMRRAAGGAA